MIDDRQIIQVINDKWMDGWIDKRERDRDRRERIENLAPAPFAFPYSAPILHSSGLWQSEAYILYNPDSLVFQHLVGLRQWEALRGDQSVGSEFALFILLLPAIFHIKSLNRCVPLALARHPICYSYSSQQFTQEHILPFLLQFKWLIKYDIDLWVSNIHYFFQCLFLFS